MISVRTLMIAFAALMLAGCYESKGLLLDASAARQPITGYQDWKYGGDTKYHARLNPRADGWYNYDEAKIADNGSDGDWEHHTVLLNYLEAANGYDVYVFGTWDDGENAYFYGLVVVGANGFWQSVTPHCDNLGGDAKWIDSDRQTATSAGAKFGSNDDSGGTTDACTFTDAGSLFQAMRNLVAQPGFWDRVQAAAKG